MKQTVITVGALLSIAGSMLSMSLVCLPKWGRDDLDVAPDSVHDLGLLRQGVEAKGDFELRNPTSTTVRLLEVSTSCGCTGYELSRREVAPGQSAMLTLTLNTGEARGTVRIRAVVVYQKQGEEQKRVSVLQLQAQMDPDYGVEPERLEFGAGRPSLQRVVLWPRHIPQLRVMAAACNQRFFEAQLVAGDDQQQSVLEVRFLSDDYYSEAGPACVTVFTDSQRQPTVRIPVEVASRNAPRSGNETTLSLAGEQ
jgi:hypothetical protein